MCESVGDSRGKAAAHYVHSFMDSDNPKLFFAKNGVILNSTEKSYSEEGKSTHGE